MVEHKHMKMTGFWEVPESVRAKTKSLIPAPQSEKASQNERRIADWLRKSLVSPIVPREEATKE